MDKRQLFKQFLGEAVFDYQYTLLKLSPDWHEPVFNLSDLEFFALQIYTSSHSYFDIVNKALREGRLPAEFNVFVDLLQNALDKLPNYEGVCYRGIKSNGNFNEFITSYSVGSKHVWQAFTSCSPYENEAYQGNVLFHINSKTGKNLQFFTADGSDEVLFKPKTCYKVTGSTFSDNVLVLFLDEIESVLP